MQTAQVGEGATMPHRSLDGVAALLSDCVCMHAQRAQVAVGDEGPRKGGGTNSGRVVGVKAQI